jgi:ornithine cyclodeaminase
MNFLDAQDIERLHDPAELVGALKRAFSQGVTAPPRSHLSLGETHDDGVLLLMPAWRTGEAIGVKIATVLPRAADAGKPTVNGVYVLLSAHGEVRAMLDAKALTLARTAAASALAASLLAPPDASTLVMVGTGALAPHLIRAHAAVRPLARVMIWGRSADKAAALAERMRAEGRDAQAAEDLADAVGQGDIVSCATLSCEPLIQGGWLQAGAHLDLVGGYTLQMREADDAAIRRADVFVDTMNALVEAGDLADPVRTGVLDPAAVTELAALVRTGGRTRRRGDITLFKSVGMAVSDLAAGELFASKAG